MKRTPSISDALKDQASIAHTAYLSNDLFLFWSAIESITNDPHGALDVSAYGRLYTIQAKDSEEFLSGYARYLSKIWL